MVDSKHQWKAWLYLLPAIILLLIFTVWPIINTVATSFIYDVEYKITYVQVEEAEDGGYHFYRLGENNKKEYIVADGNEGSVELSYSSQTKTSYIYNEELGVWTTVVGTKTFFIGADKASDLNLFELNEESADKIGKSVYPAGFYLDTSLSNIIHPNTEEVVFGEKPYIFGVFKGIPEAYMYVKNATEAGDVDATSFLSGAAKIWPKSVKVDGVRGYKLYVENNETNTDMYLNVAADADGVLTLQYALDDGNVFFYNNEKKAWTCTVNDVQYYIALDGLNSRLSIYPVSDLDLEDAPAPAVIYMHRGTASEAKPVTQLIADNAYRMGAHRAADGSKTYLTDAESDTTGLRLTKSEQGDIVSKFGFKNFVDVLTDKGSDFMLCLKNTLILTVITVPISTILALLIAVALNSIKPLQRFLQTIFFLPYVTNSIAIGMVFAAMFNIVGLGYGNESVGIINNLLGVFGIERINWINQGAATWASFTALIIYIVWNALPFKILILLGGLQSVNKQYYDAAKVDGTPKWRVLLRITVPLLSPMITYTVITSFIGGFKEYSSVVGIFGDDRMVTGGVPNMNTIVGHIQDQLGSANYGRAGAAALILFAIIFVVTMFNLWLSKKSTHY